MWIKQLFLQQFRNYERLHLDLQPSFNIFVGDNAQGKTNLLEAMYVLAAGRSFRASKDQELIMAGKDQMKIAAKVARDADIRLDVQIGLDTPKKLLVNQKPTRPGYFFGQLNVVLFTPDDLQLIKGSPGGRRRFLDEEIGQVNRVYRDLLSQYQKVLLQRNKVLKEHSSQRSQLALLDVFDEQMIDIGSRIMVKRSEAIHKLSLLSRLMHRRITNGREELSLEYLPFFRSADEPSRTYELAFVQEEFQRELAAKRDLERARGFSLVGPQRDDLGFFIQGLDAKIYASQGQQRTAVLACRLAEMEYMRSESGTYPVVLLDDVMSELDHTRRQFLIGILKEQIQTVITTTHLGSFSQSILEQAQVLTITNGQVQAR